MAVMVRHGVVVEVDVVVRRSSCWLKGSAGRRVPMPFPPKLLSSADDGFIEELACQGKWSD